MLFIKVGVIHFKLISINNKGLIKMKNTKKDYTITFIVGSNNPNSFTYYCVINIINNMIKLNNKNNNSNYLFDVVFLKEYELQTCVGCNQCFVLGKCPLETKDSYSVIKKKLLKSDVVIWSSPVYVGFISSIMKNYIDRSALSCHLMDYAGRIGFCIVTTNLTNAEYTINYIKNIQISFGIKNIENFIIKRSDGKTNKSLLRIAEDITEYINRNNSFSNDLLENNFSLLQQFYKEYSYEEVNNVYEFFYWNKISSLNIDSFDSYTKYLHGNSVV